MKGFALDATGDVVISDNKISIVVGDELLRQKVWTVLRTNLKEWFFDWEQGIDYGNLLGRSTSEEMVRFEIERGLRQVDATFEITEFVYSEDKNARSSVVTFKAVTASGQEAGGELTWA